MNDSGEILLFQEGKLPPAFQSSVLTIVYWVLKSKKSKLWFLDIPALPLKIQLAAISKTWNSNIQIITIFDYHITCFWEVSVYVQYFFLAGCSICWATVQASHNPRSEAPNCKDVLPWPIFCQSVCFSFYCCNLSLSPLLQSTPTAFAFYCVVPLKTIKSMQQSVWIISFSLFLYLKCRLLSLPLSC